MDRVEFLKSYFEKYRQALFETDVTPELIALHDRLLEVKEQGKKMMLAGNGASASIAAHGAVDFTKQACVKAVTFNEAALISAFANDYGYEHWVQKAVEFYAEPGDVVVLISSSGKSPNIVNAAQYAKEQGITVVTFSGFASDNPLKSQGDINFWVDSKAYNIIENTHAVWLLTACDMILGKAEYSVS
ncbi:MAG: SIS domain-containing protein [bacterium]|nr:SIS domain-containing protein [bacterium]